MTDIPSTTIQLSFQDLPDHSIGDLLSIRHDETFSNARRRKKGPKAAVSAFAYFNAANLESIVNELSPDMQPDLVVEVVSDRWRTLSDTERAKYEQLAERDLQRYSLQCRPSVTKAKLLADKKAKKRKHPGAPKHPKSAYLFFVGETRDRVKSEAAPSHQSFTAIARLLGEKWKELPAIEKQIYQNLANQDKERYRREKELYCSGGSITIGHDDDDDDGAAAGANGAAANGAANHDDDISHDGNDGGEQSVNETGKRRRKHPLAPKHPLSAYLFFVATHRAALTARYTDQSFTDVAKMIGDVWKEMTPLERRKYEILASADKMRYGLEMKAWAKSAYNPINQASPISTVSSTVDQDQETADLKRSREREAAQTISSLSQLRPDGSTGGGRPVKKRSLSTQSMRPVTPSPPPPPQPIDNLQYGGPAYLAFVKSESSYILSVDPDIDIAELDAALRLTWMEMSHHEKLAFDVSPVIPSSITQPIQSSSTSDDISSPLPDRIEQWTSTDIAKFVSTTLGFERYYDRFVNSGLTGADLSNITTAYLKKNLLIDHLGERKMIKTAFDDLVK